MRSSCEEGPEQSVLQSAYHDPQLDVTELKNLNLTREFDSSKAKTLIFVQVSKSNVADGESGASSLAV